jgi:hypothetical protein
MGDGRCNVLQILAPMTRRETQFTKKLAIMKKAHAKNGYIC